MEFPRIDALRRVDQFWRLPETSFRAMATIHILRATEWHRAREIRLRALSECPDAFGSTLEREQQFTEVDWRKRLENSEAITMVAIEHHGMDVGLIVGGPYGEFAGLFSMWIDPTWRRRGIGGCLVDAVIDWARQLGKRKLLLDVGDWNTGAIALYRSRGFTPTGQIGSLPFPRDHVPEQQLVLLLGKPRRTRRPTEALGRRPKLGRSIAVLSSPGASVSVGVGQSMKTPFLVSLVFALAIGLVSGRASELVLPDDPFRFPVLPDGRIDSVARLVGSAAGVPVTITGPYIAEHLTWISKNGRKMEGSHTVFRDDILDTDALKQLLAWVTPQREVFFYAWGKDPMIHLEWGYAVIEGDRLVHRMILGQELN